MTTTHQSQHTHTMLHYTGMGNWEDDALRKKKSETTHSLFNTQTLAGSVCVTKMPTQKHISLVCEMEIKFRADVPITCLALPASLGVFSFLTEAVRFSIF